MFTYMSWIVVGYGLAALLVHLFHRRYMRSARKDVSESHYIMVTCNHEHQLEWYIRALSWYARLRGECIRVTILDEASEDDTQAILSRLYNEAGISLNVLDLPETAEEVFDRYSDSAELERDLGQGWELAGDVGDGYGDLERPVYIDLRVPQEANKIPYVHSRI